MPTKSSAVKLLARAKLISRVAVSQKLLEAAKKTAKGAKIQFKHTKQKFKAAKRAAKVAKKIVKTLKAELVALATKKSPARPKSSAKKLTSKRVRVLAPAIPASTPDSREGGSVASNPPVVTPEI
jgi:hypothetical protein